MMNKITYETNTDEIFNETFIIKIEEDGTRWSLPNDPANSDYQAYLKSLDEASTL
jgi:hypothetical protein